MGLNAMIVKATQTAFKAVGDLAPDAVLLRDDMSADNYDPSNGGDYTENDTSVPIKVIPDDIKRLAHQGIVLPGSSAFLIQAGGLSIKPTPNDRIVVSGYTYEIKKTVTIPNEAEPALFIVGCNEVSGG